jgi:hypothetical protein
MENLYNVDDYPDGDKDSRRLNYSSDHRIDTETSWADSIEQPLVPKEVQHSRFDLLGL